MAYDAYPDYYIAQANMDAYEKVMMSRVEV